MLGTLQLGPLMIVTDRLTAIVLIWVFLGAAAHVGKRTGAPAGRASWVALVAGLIAARLGYVIDNLSAFIYR